MILELFIYLAGNLLPAHSTCNLKKGKKKIEEMDLENANFTVHTEVLDASFLLDTVKEKLRKAKQKKKMKRKPQYESKKAVISGNDVLLEKNKSRSSSHESESEFEIEATLENASNSTKYGKCYFIFSENNCEESEESEDEVSMIVLPKPNSAFKCCPKENCLRFVFRSLNFIFLIF